MSIKEVIHLLFRHHRPWTSIIAVPRLSSPPTAKKSTPAKLRPHRAHTPTIELWTNSKIVSWSFQLCAALEVARLRDSEALRKWNKSTRPASIRSLCSEWRRKWKVLTTLPTVFKIDYLSVSLPHFHYSRRLFIIIKFKSTKSQKLQSFFVNSSSFSTPKPKFARKYQQICCDLSIKTNDFLKD